LWGSSWAPANAVGLRVGQSHTAALLLKPLLLSLLPHYPATAAILPLRLLLLRGLHIPFLLLLL
jgi:hypothetical protein